MLRSPVIRYAVTLLVGLIGGLATFIVHDGLLGGRPLAAMPVAAAPPAADGERWQSPRDTLIELGAPALATYILQSRQQAIAAGVQPIPPALRAKLARFFKPALLDRVRYRVGRPAPGSLASFAFELRDEDAITLVDVVVFRTPEKALNDVLWAHELQHVRQYARWGVAGFARRYLRDRESVEWEAYETQFKYRRATRAAGETK